MVCLGTWYAWTRSLTAIITSGRREHWPVCNRDEMVKHLYNSGFELMSKSFKPDLPVISNHSKLKLK